MLREDKAAHTATSSGASRGTDFKNRMLETRTLVHKVAIRSVLLFFNDQTEKDVVRQALGSIDKFKFEELMNPFKLQNMKTDDHFVLLVDDKALGFVNEETFRKNNPNATIVLLTSNQDLRMMAPGLAAEKYPYSEKADLVFSLREEGVEPRDIARTLVRVVEDRKNLEQGREEKRFLFLVIDDQPCWLSQFLPDLYKTIGRRAEVITARTYEEAMDVIDSHGENIAAVITDIVFPKGGKQDNPSGIEIIRELQSRYPRIAIAVASQAVKEFGGEIKSALVIPKGKRGALDALRGFLNDFAGLGDFVFMQNGKEIGRASNIFELRDLIADKDMIPIGVIKDFGEKDFFSTWFYMHGYREVGDRIRPKGFEGESTRAYLLNVIDKEMERIKEMPLVFEWVATGKRGKETRTVVVDSVQMLYDVLATVPERVIESYGKKELISLWLMRRGYSELADSVRQCIGTGIQNINDARNAIGEWLERQKSNPEK